MLELRNVTKTVGSAEHIRDVSLELRHGTLNVLLGPTLSGKTTLMRLMAGLDQPTSGRVFYDGNDVTGVAVQRGDFAPDGYGREVAALRRAHPFLEPAHAERLVRLYGTRARLVVGDAKSTQDMGRCFGADLYQAEIDFLIEHEWATTAEDVLWRRTKQGLRLTAEEASVLDLYMSGMASERSPAAE